MFIYFPTDWDNYRILYSARLRVIGRQRKEIIAEGLKRELAKTADYCITFFRSNTFRT